MEQQNHMQVVFDAKSENEGLARMLVTAFMSEMNPTLEQIADVKTAVSEAVTNAIIHGYEEKIGMGILYLFTMEIFGIGWFIDIISLLFKPNPYYI